MSKLALCGWLSVELSMLSLGWFCSGTPWQNLLLVCAVLLAVYLSIRRAIEMESMNRMQSEVWNETERLLREQRDGARRRLKAQAQQFNGRIASLRGRSFG